MAGYLLRSRSFIQLDFVIRKRAMLSRSRSALHVAAAAAPAHAGGGSGAQVRRVSYEKVSAHMSLMRASGGSASKVVAAAGAGAGAGAGAVAAAAAAAAGAGAVASDVGLKPLVVMLPWLLAKRQHVLKYAQLYTEHGIDVLGVHTHPGHLLRPAKGSQLVAAELLQYLKELPGRAPLLLHGFSVGGYLWGEALVQLANQPDLREALEKRFVGQVWDSVVELSEAPAGLARSVFPRSTILQGLLEKLITSYLSALHKVTTRHYELSSQHFHRHPMHCPALLLLSESDPIGTVSANEKLLSNWKQIDVPAYVKIWEGSPHVGHFRMYRVEYEDQVNQFLQRLGLISKNS
ncbi:Uncharacterized protein GBIM_11813 [Gryllus bimaculatus]|nr:Uncharacterized protein GBIM_11813 [Gryllus bimaculatus]